MLNSLIRLRIFSELFFLHFLSEIPSSDQAQCFVGPDLRPNCLQSRRQNPSSQRVNRIVIGLLFMMAMVFVRVVCASVCLISFCTYITLLFQLHIS